MSVAAEEAEVVERLVHAVAQGRRAAVGRAEVEEAVDAGAVETLLVSEELLPDPQVVQILERSRGSRARLFVVRSADAPGAQLQGFGGIAAILRYDWTSERRITGSTGPTPEGPRSGA